MQWPSELSTSQMCSKQHYLIQHGIKKVCWWFSKKNNHSYMSHVCSQCDHVTKHKKTLSRHARTKHDTVRYKCEKCGKTFFVEKRQKIISKVDLVVWPCSILLWLYYRLPWIKFEQLSIHICCVYSTRRVEAPDGRVKAGLKVWTNFLPVSSHPSHKPKLSLLPPPTFHHHLEGQQHWWWSFFRELGTREVCDSLKQN